MTQPRSVFTRSTLTWRVESLHRARRALRAGAVYFLLLLATGLLIAPLYALYLDSAFAPPFAALIVGSAAIAALVAASGFAVRQFRVRRSFGDRFLIGALAATLLLIVELMDGVVVRGWGASATLAKLTTQPYLVFAVILLAVVVAPLLPPVDRRTA